MLVLFDFLYENGFDTEIFNQDEQDETIRTSLETRQQEKFFVKKLSRDFKVFIYTGITDDNQIISTDLWITLFRKDHFENVFSVWDEYVDVSKENFISNVEQKLKKIENVHAQLLKEK